MNDNFNATDGIPGRVTVAFKFLMDSGWRYRAGSGSYIVAVGVFLRNLSAQQ